MARPETSSEIDEAAALWAARVDRGLSAEEERTLEAWLEADTRRAGAYAKARAVALHTERARALGSQSFPPAQYYPPPPAEEGDHRAAMGEGVDSAPSRRRTIMTGAIAAALACVVATGILVNQSQAQIYATRVGQVKVTPLEDGSVVTLNTASEIAVTYTDTSRDIELVNGEALFDVAKNRARPFTVEAGDTMIRAVGTSFTVRNIPGRPVEVLVREGIVEVTRDGTVKRITANVRATAAAQSVAIAAIAPEKLDRELAWRDGRLAFEGETLREAATQFARYSDTRIIITDSAIANRTIAGLYVSTDPVGFARAVGTAMDLKVTVTKGEVRLSHQ
jgi:transmembrane sensor